MRGDDMVGVLEGRSSESFASGSKKFTVIRMIALALVEHREVCTAQLENYTY